MRAFLVWLLLPGALCATALCGTAEKRFDVQGWAFKMLQVR